MGLWSRIFRPERAKSDLAAEIEAHLALAAADKRDRGADPETARREAEREFGNAALVKDVVRRMWGWVWLDSLQQDLTSALRQLRRTPRFSMTVVATLALGIGAATAMFTVVDQVLFRPLPFAHPERLVTIEEADIHGKTGPLSRGAVPRPASVAGTEQDLRTDRLLHRRLQRKFPGRHYGIPWRFISIMSAPISLVLWGFGHAWATASRKMLIHGPTGRTCQHDRVERRRLEGDVWQ